MLTVAVINQKGGVGKTTTTANLGAGLARLGKRVLLLDFDPQANLTAHLLDHLPEGKLSTYDLLRSNTPLERLIIETKTPGLSLVPANSDLTSVEMELASEIGRETILRDQLKRTAETEGRFDHVLIDCPPSLGLLAINALTAASEALVPIQAEFFALQGIARFVEVQALVRQRLNPDLKLGGILICMWRGQANLSREVRDEVKKVFGEVLYDSIVRQNVKLAEAPSAGKTIFEYAPESNGAADFAAVTVEFLKRHGDTIDRTPEEALALLTAPATPPAPNDASVKSDESGGSAPTNTPPVQSVKPSAGAAAAG